MKERFGTKIGYSDHTEGIEIPVAAVALGATVIEKHFTTDKTLPGPDHIASLEPTELKAMVRAIRNVELAIAGDGIKTPGNQEKRNILVARKSLHLSKFLEAGHVLCPDDLVALRPGNGISPMDIDNLIGRKLIKDCPIHHKINTTDFQ
jgi:N-acetylneuraminate synthase/N,N'-diacetyllegionaminate synthase